LLTARISWKQLYPLYESAARARVNTPPPFVSNTQLDVPNEPIIDLSQIHFSYKNRKILAGCNLCIKAGEHILLEGASGSGKSTFASVVSGLSEADSGEMCYRGWKKQDLGSTRWRQKVALAPQFHENHVFTETFAFNVLIGRDWPPSKEDLLEAENVCRALKLGELIDTMPAGMQQMIGESWRLSHGERSRLFIARTLLQHADVLILDESFAALDPETLKTALGYVLSQPSALLLIAHP